jgi:hypothetical protein
MVNHVGALWRRWGRGPWLCVRGRERQTMPYTIADVSDVRRTQKGLCPAGARSPESCRVEGHGRHAEE